MKFPDIAGDEFEREAGEIIACAEERSGKKFPPLLRTAAIAELADILDKAWDDAYHRARAIIQEGHL